ncbi:MAG: thioredoxin family protein [Acidobacteria bacterium]|nr:MAG: thioredoxin family protein [Acidobacteriota bacterium]PYY05186.1 MAG: thioredoxin family protein [Acidobacteriota bacterium]
MKRNFWWVLVIAPLLTPWARAVKVGESAPDFQAIDSNGLQQKLSQYRGKFVVLEWHNNGCPYTRKHYESGNMQQLQKEWTGKGVVWFTVISSAPGQQGYVTAERENDYLKQMKASPTAALLDPQGEVGRLYSAKTTPHMFVINPAGVLIYDGAIDDKATTDQADIASARNYVSQVLQEATAGKPVSTATTRPYGCSVKYAHK